MNQIKVTVGPDRGDLTGCNSLAIRAAIKLVAAHGGWTVELLPGQGRARILSGSYSITLDERIGIIVALTEHLGCDQVNIFAASWGAIVAAGFASVLRDRVEKMVLASLNVQRGTPEGLLQTSRLRCRHPPDLGLDRPGPDARGR